MAKFELYYPAKPYRVNQGWGILNPIYEQFGYSRHNGLDIALGEDKTLYAPCDGYIVRIGNQPQGGGIFLGLMSEEAKFEDGTYRALIDLLHCERLLVSEGDYVKVGQAIAIADNTGFSTGPHTHIQPRRVKRWNGKFGESLSWTGADKNDANGSFDPVPFWNGKYSQDYKPTTVESLQAYIRQLLAIIAEMKSGRPRYTGSIISLQKCLRAEGFFPNEIEYTENFGPITRQAVIEFQRKYKLNPPVGNVGPLTKAKLTELYG